MADEHNAGSSVAAPATDHDGIRRPQGSAFDIGAFEMASVLPPNPLHRWAVAGVAHNAGVGGTSWRTDLTVVNPGTVDGDLDLAPRSWRQINNVVQKAGLSDLDSGFATVEIVGTTGTIWAYASVLDNRTGDATTIPVAVVR